MFFSEFIDENVLPLPENELDADELSEMLSDLKHKVVRVLNISREVCVIIVLWLVV